MRVTHYKINSVQSIDDFLYVDVAFFVGANIIHYNDFVMEINEMETVYIGPELGDNETPNPNDFVTRETDIDTAIEVNILRYIDRQTFDKFVDQRDHELMGKATDEDPKGLIQKVTAIGRQVAI